VPDGSAVPFSTRGGVGVAVDVAVGTGLRVADGVGVRVTVAGSVVVEDAVGVDVIDGEGDALTVGEAIATRVPSCREAYTIYASAASKGISRSKSSSFLMAPLVGCGKCETRNRAVPVTPQDYSDSNDLSSPSFFLPYSPPAGKLILG